jgi:hypothetical protein
MHALLRRFSDRAGEYTDQYSKDLSSYSRGLSRKASDLTGRAGELSESALARLEEYRGRAREQANRVYNAALENPKTTATLLGVIAVGVVAAGVWGFMRYRDQRRMQLARARNGGQRSRKRVKAGQTASAA